MVQRQSEGMRRGITKFEDRIEDCINEEGHTCKRMQVFCFCCNTMWQKLDFNFPTECWNCDHPYPEYTPGLYCMPDIVIECEKRHGVIFVQDWRHDTLKGRNRDKNQIAKLKEAGYLTFIIYNEELEIMRHANLVFLVAGYFKALNNPDLYERAFRKERELPH